MSVAADLTAVAKTKLEAALGSGWAVDVRKNLTRVQGDPPQLAIVALGADRREPATGEDDFAWWGYYPVSVALTVNAAERSAAVRPDAALLTAREAAVAALTDLHGMEQSLPAIDAADYQGKPFADRSAADKGVNWSAFGVTYRTREPR